MWSMPIKNRLDMLATGIKTPVGIKIFGPDLATLDRIGDDRNLVNLEPREVLVEIDLQAGAAEATIWTNDLTHEYVHENSAYSS